MIFSDEIRRILDGADFAHLATLMPDGSPQSVPVWVGRDADRVIICTGENSLKDPEGRVALVIEVEKARYTKLPFEHTPPVGS